MSYDEVVKHTNSVQKLANIAFDRAHVAKLQLKKTTY